MIVDKKKKITCNKGLLGGPVTKSMIIYPTTIESARSSNTGNLNPVSLSRTSLETLFIGLCMSHNMEPIPVSYNSICLFLKEKKETIFFSLK